MSAFPRIKLHGRRCHSVFLIRTRDPYKPQLSWVVKKTTSNNRYYSWNISPQADTYSQSVSRTGEQRIWGTWGKHLKKIPQAVFMVHTKGPVNTFTKCAGYNEMIMWIIEVQQHNSTVTLQPCGKNHKISFQTDCADCFKYLNNHTSKYSTDWQTANSSAVCAKMITATKLYISQVISPNARINAYITKLIEV